MSSAKKDALLLFREALAAAGDANDDAAELAGALCLAFQTPAPTGLRARLLETISQGDERFAPFWEQVSGMFDLSVEAMRRVFADVAKPERWESSPIPGVELLHFEGGGAVAAADCGLVRLAAGTEFPHHEHLGTERVLLLEGGYTDETGKIFAPGDLHEMREGSSHGLKASPDEGCLFAVLLEAGINIPGLGTLGGTKK